MNRTQILSLIRSHVTNENIVKHMLALEAVMGALFDRLRPADGSTRDEWMLAGLLHDGDYCQGVPMDRQGIQIAVWAKEAGIDLSDRVVHAMAAHNWANTKIEPVSLMDWSIFCADSLTGLIVASTLVLPSRHLSDLSVPSVLKKFPQKSFARGTRREDISLCQEKLGISLEDFVSLVLSAMQSISPEIGL